MQDDGGMKAGFQRPSTRHGAQAMILPRHGAQGMALRHTLIDDVAAHALALGLLLVTVLVQRLEHKMETTGGKSKEDGSPAGSPPRGNSADGRRGVSRRGVSVFQCGRTAGLVVSRVSVWFQAAAGVWSGGPGQRPTGNG